MLSGSRVYLPEVKTSTAVERSYNGALQVRHASQRGAHTETHSALAGLSKVVLDGRQAMVHKVQRVGGILELHITFAQLLQ